ncbi:MAG: hypothetical protein ACR2H5_13760 [Ktedonobacteraceae bacterium]
MAIKQEPIDTTQVVSPASAEEQGKQTDITPDVLEAYNATTGSLS